MELEKKILLQTDVDTAQLIVTEKQELLERPRFKQAEQLAEAYGNYISSKKQFEQMLECFYDGNIWSGDSAEYFNEIEKKIFVPEIKEIK